MRAEKIENDAQAQKAAGLFAKIDSSISYMFLANRFQGNQALLLDEGAFFCYEQGGTLQLYLSFEQDGDEAAKTACRLCETVLAETLLMAEVWIRHENKRVIQALKERLGLSGDYEMTEFVFRRNRAFGLPEMAGLTADGYSAKHLDAYLALLQVAMTYHERPIEYAAQKEKYREKFEKGEENGYFREFRRDGRLTGLYLRGWQKGDEVELLAVAPGFQRQGIGRQMLAHAIRSLFDKTEREAMFLYCVDRNAAGQAFYRAFGMEVSGHSYRLKRQA